MTPRQGFGLRAVKDDAVGYAHSSDVSLPALIRAADAVAAVRGGYSGSSAGAAGPHQVRLYGDDNPLDAPGFDAKVKLLERDRRLCARPRTRACGRSAHQPRRHLAGGRDRAAGRRDLSRHPPAGAGQCFASSPAKATGRKAAATAMAAARAMRASSRPRPGAMPPTARAAGAGQSRIDSRPRRRNGRRARPRLARRDAA